MKKLRSGIRGRLSKLNERGRWREMNDGIADIYAGLVPKIEASGDSVRAAWARDEAARLRRATTPTALLCLDCGHTTDCPTHFNHRAEDCACDRPTPGGGKR